MSLASRSVLGMRVDATTYTDVVEDAIGWALARTSSYVCVANVHMVMEAFDSGAFRRVVNGANIVTPDGRPLMWALRWLGVDRATQVRGTDLLSHVVERAVREGVPVGLYGGTEESLDGLVRALEERYPGFRVACRISPPFRELTAEEDDGYVREICASGVGILLVGLGCPKQEVWMAEHVGRVPAVMIGVGAAFDFFSGRAGQAPRWMQSAGLEWAYRLFKEPRRLWRRYLKHNPRFAAMFAAQYAGLKDYE
jgi:N-acetylglucosaminyldiphosphoundecaprenol N-acetyl-beta-D-mannosaminyltransferase